MRDIKVTTVAIIDKMSKIVLTTITHGPWSSAVTGSSGGRRSPVPGDMEVPVGLGMSREKQKAHVDDIAMREASTP